MKESPFLECVHLTPHRQGAVNVEEEEEQRRQEKAEAFVGTGDLNMS